MDGKLFRKGSLSLRRFSKIKPSLSLTLRTIRSFTVLSMECVKCLCFFNYRVGVYLFYGKLSLSIEVHVCNHNAIPTKLQGRFVIGPLLLCDMAHISALVAAQQVKTYDNFIGCGDANRYKYLKYTGQGSYGIINSAIDAYTNEKVVIKKISYVFRDVPRAVKVLREIKLLRLLQHPNIVEIKSILIPPSSDTFKDIFVFFEYMNSDLRKFIASIDNLTAKDYKSFMFQILHAVKFMHAANVYHLDLKSGNILANCNGLIKVCDFRLSRVAFSEPSKEWHHTGYIGTRSYRAPEICGSELSKYPYAIDIWSIGCIFAEIMTGKPLFPWKTLASHLDLITNLVGTPSADTIPGVQCILLWKQVLI
ncbi:mitogen-activated protein kinase 18-like [Apium graveolens]|uniref:mitogen-activated protein kinase 18-like n=1 Tax=Apium graveolens TaxID=4045 RepID=UPI003D7AF078